MSTTDTVLPWVVTIVLAGSGLTILTCWLYVRRLPIWKRGRTLRCRHCREAITYRPGYATDAKDRRRDHEKECLS